MPNWSKQQEEIFNWFQNGTGNLVVRARAGTGKTTTIIEGVNRAPEDKILLCAFNKKIAVELNQRIKNQRAEAKTLHGIGFSCVLRNWNGVQVDENRGLTLASKVVKNNTPDEITRLVAKLAARCKSTCPFPESYDDLIDEAYEADLIPDEEFEEGGWDVKFVAEAAWNAMELATHKDGTIDFDDMVFVPIRNKWVFGRWDLVVVDEAQDMNLSQLILAKRSCKKNGRIAVVGDDRQAIYGFRGADSGSIDRLKRELNAKELGLTVTYRCGKKIVDLARNIVYDYEAHENAPEGEVRTVTQDLALKEAQGGDFVLSRKNAPLAGVCLALLKMNKRAKVEGKDVGKNLLSIVKKVKGRSIPDFISRLENWKNKEFARASKLEERKREAKQALVSDQYETLLTLVDGLSSVNELQTRIENLFQDVAEHGAGSFIVCSSVHKAKGLERENVFLLEETFNERNIEECNIKYVAITRAKSRLTWVTQSPTQELKVQDLYPQGVKSEQLVKDVALGVLNPLTDEQAVEWIEMNSPKGII